MRRLLNNPWVVAALAVAAIAFVGFSLVPTTKVPSFVATAEPEAQAVTELPTSDTPHVSAQDALKQLPRATVTRDPFATHATTELVQEVEQKQEPDFVDTVHLSGIWTQNGATFVLINEHVRCVGESVGRLQIESASQDGIWLTHWKGRSFLELGKSFVLKTPARQSGNLSTTLIP